MILVSVNIAQPRPILFDGRQVMTAIFKQPIRRRVAVGSLGVEGDAQADQNAHGGVDQAVYAYPHEHYAFWQDQLGRESFPYGQFGENFTLSGLLEDRVQIGDTLKIGDAVLQVSQPRTPCFKLGFCMEDASFIKKFSHSLRVGYYLRVLTEGHVEEGDAIEHIPSPTTSMTVRDVYRLRILDRSDRRLAQQATELPAISESWREAFRVQAETP